MNLLQKIHEAIKNTSKLDNVLAEVEKRQSNLLKNINSPLLDNSEKNKLLKVYMDLHDVGKSLYKYNVLKKNNHLAAAEEEKEEIERKVLKGYICNVKYVWRSEHGEHTCDECASMDGEEFESDEDIPPQPHPNCKCYIEVLECPYEPEYSSEDDEDDEENENPKSKKPQEEPCDCWDKIDELVAEADSLENEISSYIDEISGLLDEDAELYANIQNLRQEILEEQAELVEIIPCGKNCIAYETGLSINVTDISGLERIFYELSGLNDEAREVYEIFLTHKKEMEVANNGMDKYYHAKANCTAAELGEMQEKWANVYSWAKEVKDFLYKVLVKHMNVRDVWNDCAKDLQADKYGIQKAKEHGNCKNKVKNVYKDVFSEDKFPE
ncbi:MAG: hypothetical protein K6A44_07820 [bacterium]|nr:hypothetical protein [bacterium]